MLKRFLLIGICLVGCLGCDKPVRTQGLQTGQLAPNIAPTMLAGTWKTPYTTSALVTLLWTTLVFEQSGAGLAGTYEEHSQTDWTHLDTKYDMKELRLEGSKVYFYVDKIGSSSNLLKMAGIAPPPRRDFYITVANDGQSLDLYRKNPGQSDYVFVEAFKKKL